MKLRWILTSNESKIVYLRFKEVCPPSRMSELDIQDAKVDVNVAFKIIGYEPRNFDESFQKTWESSDAEMLYEFVYDVWRVD